MRLSVHRTSVAALVALALLCLFAAWQSRHLAEIRRSGMPEAYVGYTSDTPPALNFVMVGLGGFRGIVSEILWFRVNTLQEEGRFMELVQLSDWITMLDPHAAEAWAYNAWNLAYNISVLMIRPEDRMRWVENGIALLRDEGLRFNPREARLYRELAWLYQNKIGDNLDSAHVTYKLALAETMAPLVREDGTLNDTTENRLRLAALKLDADRMLALEKRFGRLDWRIAETHAAYWADQGLAFASGTERLMCLRGIYQPLMLSLLRGHFTGDLAHKKWGASGNPTVAVATADLIAQTCREFPSRNMSYVHSRYLVMAIAALSKSGLNDEAHALYDRLLPTLSPDAKKPTFDDVLKGWEPPYDGS